MEGILVLIATPLVALIPALGYLLFVWWLDRYDREPFVLVAAAFLWGALAAVFFSVVVSLILQIPIALTVRDAALRQFLGATFVAPPVEEFFKGIVLLALAFHKKFDNIMDGLVYGAAVGLGFATSENVLYYLGAYAAGGTGQWATVVVLRTAYSTMLHVVATGWIGVGIAWAKWKRDWLSKILLVLGGYGVAMAVHFVGNFLVGLTALTGKQLGGGAFVFFMINMLIYLCELILVFVVMQFALAKEQKVLKQELAQEVVAGTLASDQAETICSYLARLRFNLPRLFSFRWAEATRFELLCAEATELAFRRHQMGLVDERRRPWFVDEVRRLQARVRELAGEGASADGASARQHGSELQG